MIPWIVACQAPLSMGFFSHKYRSGLPFSPPGDLPDSGMFEPMSPVSPTLQADSLSTEASRKSYIIYHIYIYIYIYM